MTAALGALGLLLLAGFLYFRFRYVRKVNEELDRLNTTKDRLFAIVSHDLRGSISAFQNIGQIINFHLKKGNYDRLGVVANQVDKSANNLNNLLDNLLQWSLSQLEGVDLNPTKLNVRRSVDDIVELFEQNAAAKGTNLQSFIKEDLQAIVDENSLHLVLRNLVSNAIKYTSEGDKIEIHGVENDKFVELSIKDTGTGIPQEKMARIFQIDSKTSSKGTSGERGTGLGLALCKEFVERNGGTIELKSVFGEGTVCQFRLPKAI
jgi:signal transduction histidine kinase